MSEDTKELDAQTVSVVVHPESAPAPVPARVEVKLAQVAQPSRVPTSGQSGPPIKLEFEKLNDKERKIVEYLDGAGTGPRSIITIPRLAAVCFKAEADSEAQAASWVRNSLRRLVRGEWVEKFVRGSYRISQKGRMKLKFVAD